jgi:hypothetical protein
MAGQTPHDTLNTCVGGRRSCCCCCCWKLGDAGVSAAAVMPSVLPASQSPHRPKQPDIARSTSSCCCCCSEVLTAAPICCACAAGAPCCGVGGGAAGTDGEPGCGSAAAAVRFVAAVWSAGRHSGAITGHSQIAPSPGLAMHSRPSYSHSAYTHGATTL